MLNGQQFGSSWSRLRDIGEQLPMFMSAREIKSQYQPLDADRDVTWVNEHGHPVDEDHPDAEDTRMETDDEMWKRKADEMWDHYPRTAQDIMRRGVVHPVHLGQAEGESERPQVVGGHHRIAFMGEESPDELMPVLHHEDIIEAKGLSTIWQPNTRPTTKYYPYT